MNILYQNGWKNIKPLTKLEVRREKRYNYFYLERTHTKEIFILNKILTGSFRMGVSSLLTLKA